MINVIPFRPLAGHDEFTIQFGSPLPGYYKLNVTIGHPLTFSWVHTIKTKKNISSLVKVIQKGEESSNLVKKNIETSEEISIFISLVKNNQQLVKKYQQNTVIENRR